jgi:drug/metabolite transporter (DMT)-like permease
MIYLILVFAVGINALANTAVREGMSKVGDGSVAQVILKGLASPIVLAGVLMFAVGLSLYAYVLSKLNLNIAYPVAISFELIFVLLASWIFLKEAITLPHMFGVGFILGGIWLVTKY